MGQRSARDYFLRGFGVELLSRLRYGSAASEVPKPIFQVSIWLALCNCCVHILPVAMSITIITLNLAHLYVGFMTGQILSIPINLALIQLAAKFQELLIVASITAIVIHAIRKELTSSRGVPLGIIGGGFLFTSISYFWSSAFCGAMKDRSWSKVSLSILLVMSGLLASTVGPSSAVLLIPRVQDWPAGSAQSYLSGTREALWPEQLSAQDIAPLCRLSNAANLEICPSGGFSALQSRAKKQFHVRNLGGSSWNISTDLLFVAQDVHLTTSLGQFPDIRLNGNCRASSPETASHGINLASALVQYQIARDWDQASKSRQFSALQPSVSEYKYYFNCNASSETRIPAVRVACSDAQNISSIGVELLFPTLPEFDCWNGSVQTLLNPLNATPIDTLRTTWTSLPPSFGSISMGLVVEAPWDLSSSSRAVLGCSIDARWTDGTQATSLSGQQGPDAAIASAVIKDQADKGVVWTRDNPAWQCSYSNFRPSDNTAWTRITIHQDWLEYLAPTAPLQYQIHPSRNMSTLEALLSDMGLFRDLDQSSMTQTELWNQNAAGAFNRTVSLEWTLSNVLADALSRQGVSSVLNMTGYPESWTLLDYHRSDDFADLILFGGGSPLLRPGEPFVEQEVTIVINGYSFIASEATDYISIAILLFHALLALAHVVELVLTRTHSSCWDTLTELLALALNSRPDPTVLRNTGAGITQLQTFSKIARVRAIGNSSRPTSSSSSSSNGNNATDPPPPPPPPPPLRVEFVFSGAESVGPESTLVPTTRGEELTLLLSAAEPPGLLQKVGAPPRGGYSLTRRARTWSDTLSSRSVGHDEQDPGGSYDFSNSRPAVAMATEKVQPGRLYA